VRDGTVRRRTAELDHRDHRGRDVLERRPRHRGRRLRLQLKVLVILAVLAGTAHAQSDAGSGSGSASGSDDGDDLGDADLGMDQTTPTVEDTSDTSTPTTGDARLGIYSDSDHTQVIRTLAEIAHLWGPISLDASVGVDAVTSASIDVRT